MITIPLIRLITLIMLINKVIRKMAVFFHIPIYVMHTLKHARGARAHAHARTHTVACLLVPATICLDVSVRRLTISYLPVT